MNGNGNLPTDPHEAAAWWHGIFESGLDTAEDRARFDAWIAADPRHRTAFNAMNLAWEGITGAAADPALLQMREEALGAARRRGSWLGRLASVAAAIAVVAVGVGAYFELRGEWPLRATFETAIGERSTVTLADGSRVTLNTNTRLLPAFNATERRVVLSQGQAFFEVAKDPTHPFIVEAGGRRVRAVGTAFDVRVEPAGNGMEVTLVEGRVLVEPSTPSSNEQPKALEPGQQFIARSSAPAAVRGANVDRVTSWREGRLIFDNLALAEAIEEVNRYSRTQIVIGDPRLARLRVSGVFNAGRPISFVEGLTGSYGVRVTKRSDEEIVLMLRE